MEKLRQKYTKWKIYRQTLRELRNLTEADLKDLGISRYNIREIAKSGR